MASVRGIWNEDGKSQESAPHARQILYIDLEMDKNWQLEEFDILRRKEGQKNEVDYRNWSNFMPDLLCNYCVLFWIFHIICLVLALGWSVFACDDNGSII